MENYTTPFKKQLFYMQKAKQCDLQGNAIATCPNYLYLTSSEMEEYRNAYIKNDTVEKLDAFADILVCVAGAVIEYGIVPVASEYNFDMKKTNVNIDYHIDYHIEKLQELMNEEKDKIAVDYVLTDIWNFVIYASNERFDIQGALNTVFENNDLRAKKDKNGDFVLEPECLDNGERNPNAFKVVKIQHFPKPDLEKFIL